MFVSRIAAAALGCAALWVPAVLAAQADVEALGRRHGVKPPPGYYDVIRADPRAFQFSGDNGWIRRARAIATERRIERARMVGGVTGFAPFATQASQVVAGDLRLPVFLILYQNTDSVALVATVPRDSIDRRMFGTGAAPPYSVHSYYSELSNDLLDVKGTVFEWTRVSEADSVYEAGCSGLCTAASGPFTRMIDEVVQQHDSAVDYGQFDNDGPDGVPNSGDDDGYVDAIVLLHPEVDGACGNGNIWAHRWSYRTRRGSDLSTGDAASSGGMVKIRDYIVQGGQGGDTGCTSGQPQSIGVISHETGHLFGLPDLYDTSGEGEGIGWWGLMGSGNWRVPSSPAHMSAWTKAELGWVTEILIARDTVLSISPVVTGDTTYVLPVPSGDEYFILENRQRLGSDAPMVQPGLFIWHVDSALIRLRSPFNGVNASAPNALALEQADGRTDLQSGGNRGDTSDPFPGSGNNTRWGPATLPSSAAGDGSPSYLVVDSITQGLLGDIGARIRFELPTVITTDRALAVFRLDGVPFVEYAERLEPGSEHTLDMDDVQLVDGGRRRLTWVAWSSGAARSHTFTASTRGDSIRAELAAEYLVRVTRLGDGGSVAASPVIDLEAGELVDEGTVVTLTATLDSAGHIFEGWSGDTTTANASLALDLQRPFELTATFAAPLTVLGTAPPQAVMGAVYQHQLAVTGGVGVYTWDVVDGQLPVGLRLSSDGTVTGVARATGAASFTARVRSGSQTEEHTYSLDVVPPALVVNDVVRHLLGLVQVLTPDEIRYLDLVGNETGQLDLGDFLAWVETTGGAVSAVQMAEVLNRASAEGVPATPVTAARRRP